MMPVYSAMTAEQRAKGVREFLEAMDRQIDSMIARLDAGEDPDTIMRELTGMAAGRFGPPTREVAVQ